MPYYLLQIRKKIQPVEKDGETLSVAQLAPLVFSITHIAVQMMLWETDFLATVVCAVLQVHLSWNIDYQTSSYLSLIFHVAAQLYWFFLMINCGYCKQKYSNHGLTAHVFHDCAATVMRNGR